MVVGRSDFEPLVPVHVLPLPVTVMELAFREDHVMVVLFPSMIAFGDADNVQVGGDGGGV